MMNQAQVGALFSQHESFGHFVTLNQAIVALDFIVHDFWLPELHYYFAALIGLLA